MEEITPEDSVAPVYLIPTTEEEFAEREQSVIEAEARQQAEATARESALAKLKKLGLTEDEALAIAGGS